jgi:small subunit ribosomal protein S1
MQNQQIGFEGEEDFAAMFEASLQEGGRGGLVKEGEVIKGTIVRVTGEYAVVDIGYKSEGQVAISEFTNAKGEVSVKAGDDRGLRREPRERHGHGRALKEKADRLKIWDEIASLR